MKSLPIYVSRFGTRAHRVRSGAVHRNHGKGWDSPNDGYVTVQLWCGQSGGQIGRKGSLYALPPEGYPLCGTCEGRAVGAGYPGIAILQTRYALIYSPRDGRAPMPAATEVPA